MCYMEERGCGRPHEAALLSSGNLIEAMQTSMRFPLSLIFLGCCRFRASYAREYVRTR